MKPLRHLSELTESEIENRIAREPLPKFADQADELYHAEQWAKSNARSIACHVTGSDRTSIKKQWLRARREILESRRFYNWTARHDARLDTRRGMYLIHNPNPELVTA
jgi:hypothetical protein